MAKERLYISMVFLEELHLLRKSGEGPELENSKEKENLIFDKIGSHSPQLTQTDTGEIITLPKWKNTLEEALRSLILSPILNKGGGLP